MNIFTLSCSQSRTFFCFFSLNVNKKSTLIDISSHQIVNSIVNLNTRKVLERLPSELRKVQKDPIDLIVVDKGPGSFTGIRTAVAFAKGLSHGANIPILSLSILDALCLKKFIQHNYKPKNYSAKISARNGNVYKSEMVLPNNIAESFNRTAIKFGKSKTYDEVDVDTINALTTLGVYKYLTSGPDNVLLVVPLYGRQVNITIPRK